MTDPRRDNVEFTVNDQPVTDKATVVARLRWLADQIETGRLPAYAPRAARGFGWPVATLGTIFAALDIGFGGSLFYLGFNILPSSIWAFPLGWAAGFLIVRGARGLAFVWRRWR